MTWAIAAAALGFFCQAALSAESKSRSRTTGRVPAAEATNALASFSIKPGFRIELAAAAPMVASPFALAFDENGRLFVTEMRDYPDRRAHTPHSGRIRLLEDTDGEGSFNSSTVYADDLPWPSAVACYDGGIFVGATPEILYLKDVRGQDIADVRRVVFTGFGRTNAPQAEALLNSFVWGLDNCIHGGTAGMGGLVTAAGPSPSGPVALAGYDFAFDPRSFALVPEAGLAQSGMTFDSQGRKFFCDLARPLRTTMYEPRYMARNPFFPRPPMILDVLSPATRVFGLPPAEPSTAPGARPPSANAPAPIWLTAARGCVIYRGSAFPSNYFGNAFIADPAAHVIHRAVLGEDGLEVTARRALSETNLEFLASSDPLFRPMQVVCGPDGALYVADMREGGESGRIYRIVPEDFKPRELPPLATAGTYDVVAALACPDGWRRDTAARLLFERRDPEAARLLTNMLSYSRLPLARLQALHALEGQGALTEPLLLRGLRDSDEHVREHAVLLSEMLFTNGVAPDALWNRLKAMASDPSLRVRYQLAFTLGEIAPSNCIPVLADIIARNPDQPYVQAAVLSALAEGAGDLFVRVAGDARFRYGAPGWEFLRQLATMTGVRGSRAEVAQVLEYIDRTPLEPIPAFGLLFNLGDGLHRTRSSLALVDPQGRLGRFYAEALAVAAGGASVEPVRLEALRLLSVSPYTFTDVGDLLMLIVGSGESPALQSATLAMLGRFSDPGLATNLLARWPILPPPLRSEALAALLARAERVPAVLAALESGWVRPADLTPAQADFLRTYRDPAIRERAVQLLGPVPLHLPDAVKQFMPALSLKAAPIHGRQVFLAHCAACHRLGAEGTRLGPDLVTAKISGKENILTAILEPSAAVPRDYTTCVIATKEGENVIGLIGDENPLTITVRQPGGVRAVWPRENIQAFEPQPWSLMPPASEQGLTLQDMADLLEYMMIAPK